MLIELIASMFTLPVLNAELNDRGKASAPNTNIAAYVLVEKLTTIDTLDSICALYLNIVRHNKDDKDRIVWNSKDLQSMLETAGGEGTSEKAWSSRLSRQRKPDHPRYQVPEHNRAKWVPTSARRGRLNVAPPKMDKDKMDALAAYLESMDDWSGDDLHANEA